VDTKSCHSRCAFGLRGFISRSFRHCWVGAFVGLLGRDHGVWRRLYPLCASMIYLLGMADQSRCRPRRCSRSSLVRAFTRCYMPPPTIRVEYRAGRAAADRRLIARHSSAPPWGPKLKAGTAAHPVGAFGVLSLRQSWRWTCCANRLNFTPSGSNHIPVGCALIAAVLTCIAFSCARREQFVFGAGTKR